MRIIKNNKGLSLLEILMAGSLLVGLGLAVTKMSVNTNQSVKVSEKNLDIVSVLSEMRGILSDPDACQESFQNFDATDSDITGDITEIKKEDGTVVFQVGNQYGSSGIKLNTIKLNSSSTNVEVVSNNSNGSTELIVEFDRGQKANSTRFIEKRIRLNVNTQAGVGNNLVATCNSFSSGETSIWTRSTNDPDRIFYNSGNVGIGIAEPERLFHISGIEATIALTDTDQFTDSNDFMYISPVQDDLRFGFHDNSAGTDSDLVSIRSNGRVGIGTNAPTDSLHVFGNIRGSGNFIAAGNLNTNGNIASDGNLTVAGNISTNGTVTANGNMATNGALNATGNVTSGGTVTSTGDITTSSNITASGNITSSGNIAATGSLRAGNDSVCNASQAGKLRYANRRMEYCGQDGNAGDPFQWRPMNPGSGSSGSSGTVSINIYQCPNGKGGWNPGGSWGSYGCQGQISSVSTCQNIEYPNVQNRPCTLLGKVLIE